MAFTSEQIARAGHYSLDVNLRTTPTDQVGTDRPLLQALLARRQNLVGGLQYIKEQVLKDYGSNYQRYSGDDQHTYNRRNLLDDVQFSWKEAFDGFTLNRTQLRQNGIVISDDGSTRSAPGADEKMRLHNLLDTNLMALRKGFDQSRDLELHRDGSQGTGNLVGLDGLVKLDPTSGTVGGLDQSTKTYWRNYAKTSISTATQGTLIQEIEKGRRASIKHGGQWDFIICGGAFYDAFRKDAKGDITAYEMVSQKGGYGLDPGVKTLAFHGVPLVFDPTFDMLDDADSPATPWDKRCYALMLDHLTYQSDKPSSTPVPPVYDREAFYWKMLNADALITDRLNGHAVFAIS